MLLQQEMEDLEVLMENANNNASDELTYRDFINKLSDEEFAEMIIEDVLLHMCCDRSIVDNSPVCPYEVEDCMKCLVKLLKSKIEN